MARVITSPSQASFYKDRFDAVVDRSFQERSFIQKQDPPEPEDDGFFESVIESFTAPVIESGKDFIKAGYSQIQVRNLENQSMELSDQVEGLLDRKTGPGALDPEDFRKQREDLFAKYQHLNGEVDKFQSEIEPFTSEKILRDFGSLALLVASFGVGAPAGALAKATIASRFPALAGVTSRIARGGSVGSLLFSGDAVREGEDLAGILEAAGIGFVSGAAFDIATPFFAKAFRFGGKKAIAIKGPLGSIEKKIPGARKVRQAIFSRTIKRIENNFGVPGKKIANAWSSASRSAKEISGQWIEKFSKVGLAKVPKLFPGKGVAEVLTDKMAWKSNSSVLDILEGRISVSDPRVSKATRAAFQVANEFRTYMEGTAKRTIAGFKSLSDYFPHQVPAASKLTGEGFGKPGSLRNDVLKNAVYKQKSFKSMKQAQGVLDSWIDWVERGGRIKRGAPDPFISWVQRTRKLSRSDAAALAERLFIEQPRGKVPKFGSLEKGREINFPFYDPDPRRVMQSYMVESVSRTEIGSQFGKGEKKLNKWIVSVSRGDNLGFGFSKGERDAAEKELSGLVRTLMGTTKRADKDVSTFLGALRTIQTPLLAFAQIVNMGQTITNVPIAGSFPALFYGLRQVFRQDAVVEALRTGSVLSRVINDSVSYSSGSTEIASKLLQKSGFGWTELFNRVVSTHSGMQYFRETARRLAKKPEDSFLKKQIQELGGNVDDILRAGGEVTENQVLRAGQIFSERTQFLNDPASLPAFASSDWGKVLFQFKNFAYNQSILIKEEMSKSPTRALRTLIILGTVFPMTAEVTTDIRSLVTQQKKPTPFVDRYLWNITHSGSLGLVTDVLLSAKYKGLAEAGLGPTLSGVAQLGEATYSSATSLDAEPLLKFLFRRTGVGRIPVNVFSPPREGKSSLESLGYLFE